MAQYVPSSGDFCRPYRSPWGGYPVRQFQSLSTAAAMVKGTLVTILGGTSTSADCIVPSTTAGNQAAINIAGILAEDLAAGASSAVTGPFGQVYEANPGVEFKAITKGAPMGSSLVGLRRGLAWDSTLKVVYVDLTASTATDWRVVITQTLQNAGDSGGYVAFRFITHLAGQIGSTIESSSPILAFYS